MEEKNKTTFVGPWGVFWRTVVFLLGLTILCVVFSLFLRWVKPFTDTPIDDPIVLRDSSFMRRDSIDMPGPVIPRDTSLVRDWNDSIPGVRELPPPRDNYIPPRDSTRIVSDPENPIKKIVSDELIVFINSHDVRSDIVSFARQFKAAYPGADYYVKYYNTVVGTMLLGVPSTERENLMEELPSKIKGVDFIVTTHDIIQEASEPSDPDFSVASYNSYFKMIQAFDAWNITKGTPDVRVAIIDSYFDLSHPEIGERYVEPINICTRTRDVFPPRLSINKNTLTTLTHGSHVAGIAIGAQDNGIGVSGIAPKCSWIPISVGDNMSNLSIIEGLLYAVNRGADVVNMSLGRGYPQGIDQMPLEDQIQIAQHTDKRGEALLDYIYKIASDHNCVICTSAGNENILMGMDPKNRNNSIIKVEAIDGNGQAAKFSNFGIAGPLNYSTVSAPGVNIWSVSNRRCSLLWKLMGYKVSLPYCLQEMSGTSMASPVVAGAVALLKSKNKNLTPEQVISILKMTAKQTDTGGRIGPTIQIKDALDATSDGGLLNFDDLLANHDLLIGKWKSTEELNISNTSSGEKIDNMWTYFIFTDTETGVIEHHTVTLPRIYKAPLKVSWTPTNINITQLEGAKDAEGHKLIQDEFVCSPDSNHLLEVTCISPVKDSFKFKLEKVN